MNPLTLVFVLFTFVIDSVIATLLFSSALKDFTRKAALRKDALVVSFSGTVVGAVSSVLLALIPALLINLDLSIGMVFITWSLVLRYYLGVDFRDALMFSFVATIAYAIILVLTGGLFFLILRLSIS